MGAYQFLGNRQAKAGAAATHSAAERLEQVFQRLGGHAGSSVLDPDLLSSALMWISPGPPLVEIASAALRSRLARIL